MATWWLVVVRAGAVGVLFLEACFEKLVAMGTLDGAVWAEGKVLS